MEFSTPLIACSIGTPIVAATTLRARSRIPRAHLDGRRHDLGILGDGQPVEEHPPDDDGDEGDDVGEDRMLDEELGDHGAAFFSGAPSRSGVTGRPGAAFSTPFDDDPLPAGETRWR